MFFSRRKIYHCPLPTILTAQELESISTVFNGGDIATQLSKVALTYFVEAESAPQVTTYHFDLENPFEIQKINRAIKGLSVILHREVVMIPSSKAHFAIQIPNDKTTPVYFSNLMYKHTHVDGDLRAVLGVEENQKILLCNINKMPHLLIAGTTGSGKSVLMNAIIGSLTFAYTPTECKFLMIDPKQVELSQWSGLKDFLYSPIITDTDRAAGELEALCGLMDQRYAMMRRQHVNQAGGMFERIVVVIDELADLMLTHKKQVEKSIVRLAQLGRAAGIHLIVATQRPTVNVVTGLIKSNIPCRIALKVASARDSMNILDHAGAEKLIGNGDAMVRFPDSVKTYRFQAPYISTADIAAITSWWSQQPRWR